jgi:hypothetical protein
MAQAIQLNNVSSTLLPPSITEPIFEKTLEESAVMQLARRVPLSLSAASAIPVSMDLPAAGWVAEGGTKPVGSAGVGVKMMTGKKVALLVPVAEEVVRTNAAGLYTQLQADLPKSIARAFDHAAIHGIDLRTGGAGPFTDYLKMTSYTQELGTTTQANGGMYADLVKGEKQVTDAGYDFTGIAIDPRIKPVLKLQVDTQGRPIWVDSPQMGLQSGSLIGYPSYSNRGVSGSYLRSGNRVQVITITGSPTGGTFTLSNTPGQAYVAAYNVSTANLQTAIRAWGGIFASVTVTGTAGSTYTLTFGTGSGGRISVSATALTGGTTPAAVIAQSNPSATSLRGLGGDWTQCAWGSGLDITVKVSDVASYTDEAGVVHSAFQENLVLLLVEAHYGFVVGDPNAFVAYTDAA